MDNTASTSALKGHRTLATVVFTDCVSFSAKMSEDEIHTLKLIHRDLKLMKHLCEQFEGRVLKSTGDGLLMHFVSAVKAVQFAIAMQKTIKDTATQLPPREVLVHRVGIHLADIFITETDVMGNGVNIAARLQAEADPGGICISQTVYDVIKTGLTVETSYLGPRDLKNIREIVPVYKILLEPETDELGQYAEVARDLEQHEYRIRIRKLILYVCNNVWESNDNKLNAVNLQELTRILVKRAPTVEQLVALLEAAVKTLSKQSEYFLIASTILSKVDRLYPQPNQSQHFSTLLANRSGLNALVPPELVSQSTATMYEQVANELNQDTNPARIQKLIFYACKNHWISDLSQVGNVRLQDLIAELHQKATTFEQLEFVLNRCVQTLSKQAEYLLVANTILEKCQRLYLNAEDSDSAMPGKQAPSTYIDPQFETLSPEEKQQRYQNITKSLESEPDLLRIKKLLFCLCKKQWESDPAKLNSLNLEDLLQELHQKVPSSEQLKAALQGVVRTLNKPAEYTAIARILFNKLQLLYASRSATALQGSAATPPSSAGSNTPASAEASSPTSEPDAASLRLFDIRLGIVKYANPLRVKILASSVLYEEFKFGSRDWFGLRRYELHDLLQQLLCTYATYTDLELRLYEVARRLQDPEAMVKTVEVILRCVRSLYIHGSPAQLLGKPSEATKFSLDAFEAGTQELSNSAKAQHTQQLIQPDDAPQYTQQLIQPDDAQYTQQLLSNDPELLKMLGQHPPQAGQTHLLSVSPLTTELKVTESQDEPTELALPNPVDVPVNPTSDVKHARE